MHSRSRRRSKSTLCHVVYEMPFLYMNNNAMAYNSTYVHRRPYGAARATRRCGAPLRHIGPSAPSASGSRHIRAKRYVPLRQVYVWYSIVESRARVRSPMLTL